MEIRPKGQNFIHLIKSHKHQINKQQMVSVLRNDLSDTEKSQLFGQILQTFPLVHKTVVQHVVQPKPSECIIANTDNQ